MPNPRSISLLQHMPYLLKTADSRSKMTCKERLLSHFFCSDFLFSALIFLLKKGLFSQACSESQKVIKGWGVGKGTAKILLLHLPFVLPFFSLKMLCIVIDCFQDKVLPLRSLYMPRYDLFNLVCTDAESFFLIRLFLLHNCNDRFVCEFLFSQKLSHTSCLCMRSDFCGSLRRNLLCSDQGGLFCPASDLNFGLVW